MANEEKRHSAGDKVTVSGIVTSVSDNAGRVEYTVAVEDSNEEYNRPLNIASPVDPLAFTNGYAEYQKELLSRPNHREDDELPALSEDADKIREETDTPDPRERAAGNASVPVKATESKTSPAKNTTK
jgi:hypothetical protein